MLLRKLYKFVALLICGSFMLTLSNCCISLNDDCYGEPYLEMVWGLSPIYSNEIEDIVEVMGPQPLVNPGKIYTYNNLLLVSERFEGIHIFDNTDPTNPVKVSFIRIAGNADVAVRNDVLYADQLQNLVALDLRTLSDSLIVTRQERLFNTFNTVVFAEPPGSDVYFECPDPYQGVVTGWEEDSIYYSCYK